MLRIRLTRKGKKRQPTYRVVVADIESPRDGRYVEQIGHYDPMSDPITFKINEGRALHWLSVGAQPSDAVNRLLVKQGTIERLARLHNGEDIAALAAEVDGEVAVAAAVEEAIVEEVVAEAIVEAVAEEIVEEAIVEAVVEEVVAEAIVEEIIEEAVEEAIVEEIVEEAAVEEIIAEADRDVAADDATDSSVEETSDDA